MIKNGKAVVRGWRVKVQINSHVKYFTRYRFSDWILVTIILQCCKYKWNIALIFKSGER